MDKKVLIKILEHEMSRISEECYCAGWMSGLEFSLWAILQGDQANTYGQSFLTDDDLAILRELSSALNGWVYWNEKTDETTFIPMEEWLALYSEQQKLQQELIELWKNVSND